MRLTRCDVRDHINYRKNRPLAFVLILQSLAAAEIANMRRLRDFRGPAIFEFFNTICQQRTHAPQQTTALFDHFVGPSEKTVEQHTIT